MSVPCGTCNACCRNGYVITRKASDSADLPWQPGVDEAAGMEVLPRTPEKHCALLVDGRCSVYEHRPYDCRTYDCRDLAYTNLYIAGPIGEVLEKRWIPLIAHGVAFKAPDDPAAFMTLYLRALKLLVANTEDGAEGAARESILRTYATGYEPGRRALAAFGRITNEQKLAALSQDADVACVAAALVQR